MKKLTKKDCIAEMAKQYVGDKEHILFDLFVSFWYWETDFNLKHLLNNNLCQLDIQDLNGENAYVVDYCLKNAKKIKRSIVKDPSDCIAVGIMCIYEIMHTNKNLDNYDILYNFIADLDEFKRFVNDLDFDIDEGYL
ncbi:MAG: hypothetical protein MJZ34_04815 [Paludibacteraceae bacterium]|nr:hypothetical protein [Paludibacteraceae bacterium]